MRISAKKVLYLERRLRPPEDRPERLSLGSFALRGLRSRTGWSSAAGGTDGAWKVSW